MSLTSFGQSQTQLTIEAGDTYKKADQELNSTYQQILKEYSGDTSFLQSLKAAQKLWIQFRDAEMKARYPAANTQVEYGSSYPMCYANGLEELTKARTQQLRVWLTGFSWDVGCTGSVKISSGK